MNQFEPSELGGTQASSPSSDPDSSQYHDRFDEYQYQTVASTPQHQNPSYVDSFQSYQTEDSLPYRRAASVGDDSSFFDKTQYTWSEGRTEWLSLFSWLRLTLLEWLEYITRPSVAICVTLVAILYVQFLHDSVRSWWEDVFLFLNASGNYEHVSWYDRAVALVWHSADWIRGNFQRAMEGARNLGFVWSRRSDEHGLTRRDEFSRLQHDDPSRTRYPFLPALEEAPSASPASAELQQSPRTPKDRSLDGSYESLPPAFLDESDYPEGWMVYHRDLGVVLKTEADVYQRCKLQTPEKTLDQTQQSHNQKSCAGEGKDTDDATIPSVNGDLSSKEIPSGRGDERDGLKDSQRCRQQHSSSSSSSSTSHEKDDPKEQEREERLQEPLSTKTLSSVVAANG